jgi:hypothetical protein
MYSDHGEFAPSALIECGLQLHGGSSGWCPPPWPRRKGEAEGVEGRGSMRVTRTSNSLATQCLTSQATVESTVLIRMYEPQLYSGRALRNRIRDAVTPVRESRAELWAARDV